MSTQSLSREEALKRIKTLLSFDDAAADAERTAAATAAAALAAAHLAAKASGEEKAAAEKKAADKQAEALRAAELARKRYYRTLDDMGHSEYDTAWMARVPTRETRTCANPTDKKAAFPEFVEAVCSSQSKDGGWAPEVDYWSARVLATLASVPAVLEFNSSTEHKTRARNGLGFVLNKWVKARAEKDLTIGFELVANSLIAECRELCEKHELGKDLKFNKDLKESLSSALEELSKKLKAGEELEFGEDLERELSAMLGKNDNPSIVEDALDILKSDAGRLSASKQKKLDEIEQMLPGIMYSPTLNLGYTIEFMRDRVDAKAAEKLLTACGSMSGSVGSTAYFARQTGNERAYAFCERMAKGWGPQRMPCNMPSRLWTSIWLLHHLKMMDFLSSEPSLTKDLAECLLFIEKQLGDHGLGWSDEVAYGDSDDTAVGFKLLAEHGYKVDWSLLTQYERENGFVGFKAERGPSVSANAHVLEAILGRELEVGRDALIGEKGISTLEVLSALKPAPLSQTFNGVRAVFTSKASLEPVVGRMAFQFILSTLTRTVKKVARRVKSNETVKDVMRSRSLKELKAILAIKYLTDLEPVTTSEIAKAISSTLTVTDGEALEKGEAIVKKVVRFLLNRRINGQYWTDKWHASPYYVTSHTLLPLLRLNPKQWEIKNLVGSTVHWLEETQNKKDGGWGWFHDSAETTRSSAEETAYVLYALAVYYDSQELDSDERSRARVCLSGGLAFLEKYTGKEDDSLHPHLWIGKGLYRPLLVIRASVLAAQVLAGRTLEKVLGLDKSVDTSPGKPEVAVA